MFKIKNIKINNPIIVAPMAGISNDVFRSFCFEFGVGLVYGEMLSDKAIFYNNQKTMKMLEIEDDNHPVSFQLFGSDISTMIYSAKFLDENTKCDIIDINMGCPVKKVVKTGAGSSMMKNEDETVNIVKEIVQNVSKPVTVKMRLGINFENLNYLSLSKKLESVGVSAIALHARTKSQMYEGHSDWSHIKKLKQELKIPVIGNGDVKSVEDFVSMQKETGCDGVMIGRALIGNPFLIKEISNYLNGYEEYHVTVDERFNYCLKHAKKLIEKNNEKVAMSLMRYLAPHYISGIYGSTIFKNKMNSMTKFEDLENIINDYKQYLKDYSSS